MDKSVRQQDLERPRRNPQEAEARDRVGLQQWWWQQERHKQKQRCDTGVTTWQGTTHLAYH